MNDFLDAMKEPWVIAFTAIVILCLCVFLLGIVLVPSPWRVVEDTVTNEEIALQLEGMSYNIFALRTEVQRLTSATLATARQISTKPLYVPAQLYCPPLKVLERVDEEE